jgi:GntR family transcriptional regulator, vanillate catabolism transcriptional regulator
MSITSTAKPRTRSVPAGVRSRARGAALAAPVGGPALAPGVTVTLAQTVTDRLRAALMDGSFLPDQKLHEEALSAMLQVSRTPVRSALHSLAAEGLLDYVPNRGYRVRRIDLDRLISIFDVRGVLEGLAARLAAERGMDDNAQAAYAQALAEGDRIIDKGRLLASDRDRFGDINASLHDAVLRAADNAMLVDMIRLCHNIPISSDRNVLWNEYRWLRRAHDDHHRLLDAIRLRDGARAEHVMREHVHSVKLQMRALLEQDTAAKGPAEA